VENTSFSVLCESGASIMLDPETVLPAEIEPDEKYTAQKKTQ
jgi:hypothetical protein